MALIGAADRDRFAFLPLWETSKNHCSHQCLHWWQQHPTGVLHINGFDPEPMQKNKSHSECVIHYGIDWCR